MAKLACMTLPYAEYSFERALEGIARAGYKYVSFGLWHLGADVPDESDDEPVEDLYALFQRYSLTPIQLIANKQFAPGESIERAIQRIRLAQALEIPEIITCGTWQYKNFPDELLPQDEIEKIDRAFADHYRAIAQAARVYDVTLTIKPHSGNTATAPILMKTLAEIGEPNLRGCYDPGNMQFYEGIDAAQDFPAMAKNTFSIIAKDHQGARANLVFPVPGDGDVDFTQIFRDWRGASPEYSANGNVVVERADGPAHADGIDDTMKKARENMARLMTEAGLTVE